MAARQKNCHSGVSRYPPDIHRTDPVTAYQSDNEEAFMVGLDTRPTCSSPNHPEKEEDHRPDRHRIRQVQATRVEDHDVAAEHCKYRYDDTGYDRSALSPESYHWRLCGPFHGLMNSVHPQAACPPLRLPAPQKAQPTPALPLKFNAVCRVSRAPFGAAGRTLPRHKAGRAPTGPRARAPPRQLPARPRPMPPPRASQAVWVTSFLPLNLPLTASAPRRHRLLQSPARPLHPR